MTHQMENYPAFPEFVRKNTKFVKNIVPPKTNEWLAGKASTIWMSRRNRILVENRHSLVFRAVILHTPEV